MSRLAALALFLQLPLAAAPAAGAAANLARAFRENSFDRNECYRVRDLSLVKDDIRIYLTDGHLIFSKPVAGHRIAAMFTADTEGGDAEVIVFPPDRAERRSLALFTHSPNLDEHFRSALFLFTGAEYDELQSQIAQNPANKKMPEVGALMDEQWTPLLRTLSESYQARLALDFMNASLRPPDLLAAVLDSPKLGTFDVIYDPQNTEQVMGGQILSRDKRSYFDDWFSFTARSFRKNPAPRAQDLVTSDYRIEATIDPDLSMSAVTRVKVRSPDSALAAASFEIAPAMAITSVTVDGRPAESLQPESQGANLLRAGNKMFIVVPPEPLQAGRDYEFEFHHAGKVIVDAGDRVFYVAARGNWYPTHGMQFASYDLTFRYPRDLDLVAPGEVVDQRIEGDRRMVHRRVSNTIRMAGFNLGDYAHALAVRGPYTIDICANRKLEAALQPRAPEPLPLAPIQPQRRGQTPAFDANLAPSPVPDPLARLKTIAGEVGSALEFMAAKLGPPALPRLAVSPIPGTFGQGFPGLIYLSTLSYLKDRPTGSLTSKSLDLYFDDVLEAHETAHQWWGNRVTTESYRDSWLMEALANYTALLYLEKRRGPSAVDQMLDSYRLALLDKNAEGEITESAGPIVLGQRLQSSLQPAGWRAIAYGKGSWIIHMLRRRMGDQQFFAMLSDIVKRYDHATLTTDLFRKAAAQFLPPKSPDPKLEGFFDQWVYGTGIPALKLTYVLKGQAPSLRLVGTLTQSGVDDDFSAATPVEIQLARGQSITRWVASSNEPVTFTVALKQAPLKVALYRTIWCCAGDMPSWNPQQYLKFAEERSRPCRDLAARVDVAAPRRIIDLGCGPGNSAAILAERWPEAAITGLDSSEAMLEAARAASRSVSSRQSDWRVGNIAEWAAASGERFDLVFSNAALQWVGDHAVVFPQLMARVAEGGALAVQAPGNYASPQHRMLREIAKRANLRVREWHTHDLDFYYDALAPLASRLDLWATEYLQVMPDVESIVEWYKGTGLRPYLDALGDGVERERFLAEYLEGLRLIYSPQSNGAVLFPFRRIFIVAYQD